MKIHLTSLILICTLYCQVNFSQNISERDTLVIIQQKLSLIEPRNNIREELGKTKLDREREKILRRHKKIEIGDIAYDFGAVNPQGDSIRFKDIPGNYKLLIFTNAICQPCVESLKELFEVYNKYGSNITIVSFFTSSYKSYWISYVNDKGIPWVSLLDGHGFMSHTAIKYGVRGVPTFFIIDNNDKVVDLWAGYHEGIIEERLSELNL